MAETDLNKGMRCIKYLLFLFNLFFVFTGIMIIGVGATIQYVYFSFDNFLEESYLSPAILLFSVGAIIFLVAFFGCCGAVRESTCMIMVFALMLGFIFILELAAAITGMVMQQDMKAGIWSKMNASLPNYPENDELAFSIDFMQDALGCCGVDGPSNWRDIVTVGNDTIPFDGYYVPESCCAIYYDDGIISNITNQPYCKYIYGNGCSDRLDYVVRKSAVTVTSVGICLALLQLMGVIFACSLGKTIRVQKTERERRRWELREKLINSYSAPKTNYPVVYVSPEPAYDC